MLALTLRPHLPTFSLQVKALLLFIGISLTLLHFPRSKLFRLEQYTSTRLLAQFDDDLQPIQKISLRINTGNVIGPRYKIRLLRIRLTPLEHPERSVLSAALSLYCHTVNWFCAWQALHQLTDCFRKYTSYSHLNRKWHC